MPAFTYLHQSSYLQPTGNNAVDEAVAELRNATGEDWRVKCTRIAIRRLLRRTVRETFSLYVGVGDGEFQVINFYRDGATSSINHDVPAELLVAYAYGVLTARARKESTSAARPVE